MPDDVDARTLKVGECVLLKGPSASTPFVARIAGLKYSIGKQDEVHTSIKCAWFYRLSDLDPNVTNVPPRVGTNEVRGRRTRGIGNPAVCTGRD